MALSRIRVSLLAALPAAVLLAAPAQADKIDDIIAAQKLRCGIQLDFPPAGYRDSNNQPAGFDVEYCKDLAKMMGVEAEIVETPSAERIPALVSDRIDLLVASTSPTMERAKTVAFTKPYNAFDVVVLTRSDTGIKSFEDLKGKTVATVTGTTFESMYIDYTKKWGSGDYISYASEAETYLALAQGKVDAVLPIDATAAALISSGQFKDLVVAGGAPFPRDYISLATKKGENDFLRWLNMAIWYQVKDGRFKELRDTFIGGDIPSLSLPNVDF